MRSIELALVVFIIFVAFTFGLYLGVQQLEVEHQAKLDLTQKVQDCYAERNGYKQLYETANKGICTTELKILRYD